MTGIGPRVAQADAGWYDSAWTYRKMITIDNTKVPETLSDFPVLINLTTDTDLANNAQSDGDDILFTSADGVTKLSHEIEKFDSGTGELVARLMTDYARHHVLLDWNGDGLDEIFVGESCGVYSYLGQRILTLRLPAEGFPAEGPHERALVPANVAGNGRADLIVTSPHAAHVFLNEDGLADQRFSELGSERNFTLY